MSLFDVLDRESQERRKPPSVEELYGYDEEQPQEEQEHFLDRLVNDIKQKQQRDAIRSRDI